MSLRGVDYSDARPNVGQLWQAGIRYVARYIGAGGVEKRLTRDEALSLNRAGLPIVSLVEGGENDALQGSATGVDHAHAAERDVVALDIPRDRPAYFAVDFDMTDAQWPAVHDYIRGAQSVMGVDRVGIYGGLRAVTYARERASVPWLFQTYAWSDGLWYPGAQLRQTLNNQTIGGGSVDLGLAMTVDYGQWSLINPSNRRKDMPHWLYDPNGSSQYMASADFERVWSFDAYTTWHRLRLADGEPVSYPADPGDIEAGRYGQYMGAWKDPHTASGLIVDQVAMQAAINGAVQNAFGQYGVQAPQLAQDVAKAVAQSLGTLTFSSSLSGTLSGRVGSPVESAPTPA